MSTKRHFLIFLSGKLKIFEVVSIALIRFYYFQAMQPKVWFLGRYTRVYTHISPAIAVLKAEAVVASYKVLINDRNNGLRTIIITIGPIIFRKKCDARQM